jgi:hypothetical protein
MISEAVTVPLRMDARILRISAQCARSDYGDTTSNTELRLGGNAGKDQKRFGRVTVIQIGKDHVLVDPESEIKDSYLTGLN